VEKVVPLPESAAFEDYSGLDLRDGVLAVLSQADGALWVGRWDADREEAVDLLETATGGGHEGNKANGTTPPAAPPDWPGPVFPLPRDRSCRRALCTAEGVGWLDPPATLGARLVLTTDRAKPGAFPWACVAASQGLHVVALPEGGQVVV